MKTFLFIVQNSYNWQVIANLKKNYQVPRTSSIQILGCMEQLT